MGGKYSIWLFVAAVLVLPLSVYAAVKWYERSYQNLPVMGGKDHMISGFQMTNQHGSNITTKQWDNKIVVADFFFTHCPVVCPKMTNNLKKVEKAFERDTAILISSFTVDPERDHEGRLKEYAERHQLGSKWHLLTGDKKEIYRLARKSFLIVATDGDGGPNDFIHSEMLVLVDKKKRIRGYYSGTDESQVNLLINDIKKLKNED